MPRNFETNTSNSILRRSRRNQKLIFTMDVHSANNAIIIVPDEISCKGRRFSDPIEIDDEVEFLGMVKMKRGSSRKYPIVVEQEKPVFEIGESSGISPQEKLKIDSDCNCEICTEWKRRSELFAIEGCSHAYCKTCVGKYVAAKVEQNVLFIKCPDPSCEIGKLEPAMCALIIDGAVFDLWCKGLCESMVNDKFYCPFRDCAALMIDDKEEVITDAECPHCGRLFCAQCKVAWHQGFSCSEFQELGDDERKCEDLMFMTLAKQSSWQRCPKCRVFVERISGCQFITCRCKFTFCYGCGSEMTVNHYCGKCKR